MNAPLTADELLEALVLSSPGKSLGSDGLPVEVYKRYSETLVPQLKEVFEDARKTRCLPQSMNEAIIVLLLKPGKEAHSPNSYRPVSLLLTDRKLLARVLATRLAKVIHKVVHRDQSEFIPLRSTDIRGLFLNLQIPVDNPGRRAILSLDAAKAFDTVEWPYLWEVLKRFGLGDYFIQWVRLPYAAPTSRIHVNGDLSEPFPLYGHKMGVHCHPCYLRWPLNHSRLLLDHPSLLWALTGDQSQTRFPFTRMTTLLYGDVDASLKNVMQVIQQFGSLSNWSKSVLPVDDPTISLPAAAEALKVVSSFKYLGVQVSANPLTYLEDNLLPLFKRLQMTCNTWCKLPLSVIRRLHLIKMVWGTPTTIHYA